MIDLNNAERSQYTTTVRPADSIFEELGKNTYNYTDLLSELIDNSIAARPVDVTLNVTIDIYVDGNINAIRFVITDNASGIPFERLGRAIAPAGIQSINSLNEHGLGMKQAIAALGKLEYLATKVSNEPRARVIKEFRFGEIETFEVPFNQESGTEIAVKDLKPVIVTQAGTITRSIIPDLGARYRHFLRPDKRAMQLELNLKSIDNPGNTLYTWNVEAVKPTYFHPSTRTNQPVIHGHEIANRNWKARLTFGYAPKTDSEYEELGIEPPNKFHPYRVSMNKQGLDIMLHNRVILFHQLSELEFVPSRHPDYNTVRGEIELIEGFSTAITKNSMIFDQNFQECMDMVKGILKGEKNGPGNKQRDYLKQETYPDEIPEKLLRDRLIEWLVNNPMQRRLSVNKEYVVGGIEGYIDIYADDEAWELKTDQASAFDVYQLFMYMDIGKISKGFLVAKSFSPGATIAAEHVKNTHNKEIVLAIRSRFPINQPPTDGEREEYY